MEKVTVLLHTFLTMFSFKQNRTFSIPKETKKCVSVLVNSSKKFLKSAL